MGRGVELGACLGTLLLARLNSHLALHHFTLSPPPAPSSLSSHPAASPSVHTFPSHCALVPQFTPGHITIWEGFTTLGFMPVFVYTTWLVDTRGFNWFGPNKNVGCSWIYGSGFGGSGFTRDFQRFERNKDVGLGLKWEVGGRSVRVWG